MSAFARPLLRILALWRGRAGWLWLGLIVSLVSAAAGIALLTQSGAVVAVAIAGGGLVAPLGLRLLGINRVILRYAERLATHAATFRALADLRVWFFRGLAVRAAGGLGYRRAGDVLTRLVSDVEALDGLYLRIAVPLAIAVLTLPIVVVLLAAPIGLHIADPRLALAVGVLLALAAFVVPALAARRSAAGGSRLAAATASLRVAVLDSLTGLREARAYGAEGRLLAGVQAREAGLLAAQRGAARELAFAGGAALLAAQAAILVVLLTSPAHPAGSVIALFLVTAAFEAVALLPRAGALAGHARAAALRVLEAAEGAHPLADPPHPVTPPASATLRFEAIGFRWQPDRPPVFDGLTLEIPQGARVAILGPSGAGKSTLAALALRLAAPQAGRVLLGGVDITTLAAAGLRQKIALLAQSTHLFDDTVRGNLLLARPDADEPALWAALAAARLDTVIRALPDGLDTWVGEGGQRLSGGQGRRLALARALLSAAPILILDEPCAGLDAETEREFFALLNDAAEGRTIILIAHRLTGVERLDRIWRLSAGHAVAAAG